MVSEAEAVQPARNVLANLDVRLSQQGRPDPGGQRLAELFPGADAEFAEHLAQVPLDRAPLRNNFAPISGFVCPSAASRAISASCPVSSPAVFTVRLRTFSAVASSGRVEEDRRPR